MKTRVLFPLLMILMVAVPNVFATDIGAGFYIGNLFFNPDRSASSTTFTADYFTWGLAAYGSDVFSEQMIIEGSLYSDPVLRRISQAKFFYRSDFFTIGVGPHFGLFNSNNALLKSGISTNLRFELPAAVFMEINSATTFSARLVENGDYMQEASTIGVGFQVPNAICTLQLENKKFTQKKASSEVVDSLVEYAFITDIFQKNRPYNILITLALRTLSKTYYPDAADTTKHSLNSLLLGTEVRYELFSFLHVYAGVNGNVYMYPAYNLQSINTDTYQFLFNATAGFDLNME